MIRYEWVVETVDQHDDIGEVNHADTLAEAREYAKSLTLTLAEGERIDIGLVRDVIDADENLKDRQWAYLENGKLPSKFDEGAKVPARFIREANLS